MSLVLKIENLRGRANDDIWLLIFGTNTSCLNKFQLIRNCWRNKAKYLYLTGMNEAVTLIILRWTNSNRWVKCTCVKIEWVCLLFEICIYVPFDFTHRYRIWTSFPYNYVDVTIEFSLLTTTNEQVDTMRPIFLMRKLW